MSATVLHGDCIERMRDLADSSVDSIVTDPPYELGFMGRAWDASGIANSVEMWREALRVLKPGGHLLAFSATRTQHRMVCAIEDAGFEIRDQVGWMYGTGFPKSLDVSKAIDKAGGMSPKDQAALLRQRREAAGLSRMEVAEHVGCTESSVRDWEEGRARAVGRAIEYIVPSDAYRSKLADILGYSADERRLVGVASDRREDGTVYGIGHSGELREGGNTPAAQQWAGWGTALKPAWEPICVARKPLREGTVAANVLVHGTGALNIDACRVGTETISRTRNFIGNKQTLSGGAQDGRFESTSTGRWPANVIHDGSDEVLEAFAQFGERKSGARTADYQSTNSTVKIGRSVAKVTTRCDASSGTAARFFYSAKAGAKDRIVRDVEEVTVEWTSEQGRCLVKLQADTAQSLQKAIVVSGSMDGSEWSTFLFGSGITDLFRKASKCTTSTKTSSTTGLRTWNCLMRSLTNACIADVSCETESGGSRASSAASGPQSLTITLAETAYLPGASLALSGTQLRISASARKHSHPTCKPLSLMRYLCKLVTPPGGTVLDMFAGSGTTLQAAMEEGFRAIGIEREAEYHADILRRMELARKAMERPAPKPKAIRVAKPKPRKPANTDTPTLFDLMVCESA